jgi:hypothetical protein
MRFTRLLGAVVVFYGLIYIVQAVMQILSQMRYEVFALSDRIIIGINLAIGIVALVNGIGLLLTQRWAQISWLVTVTLLVLFHNLILLIMYLAGQDLTQQILNVLLISFLAVISWARLGNSLGKKQIS